VWYFCFCFYHIFKRSTLDLKKTILTYRLHLVDRQRPFQISFELTLNGTMDFSKCKTFSIRGYNKVKLTSVVSTEIKDCKAFNPILINPNVVIDAVGLGVIRSRKSKDRHYNV
jgi:hypothetical protein